MAMSMNGVNINSASLGLANPPAGPFRFFRINIQSFVGGVVRIESLRPRVGSTNYPSDATHMTSDTTPSPLVSSASSVYPGSGSGPFPAWMAFATTPGSSSIVRWISNFGDSTPWLQIDLGAGNDITPTAVLVGPDGDSGATIYIQNFTFSGSTTGAFTGEQTLLYTSATLNSSFWTASLPVVFTF